MAAPGLSRAQVDAELEHLARMLPPWREKLRHEAQFWPQFQALSDQILERAGPADRDYVRDRLAAMLAEQGLQPPG
ncbi:MAG: hypothetical protein EOP91_09590 [Lysobacteraceae bacterium]|nr:MAG: hypothetical protein EOP91_09590 [Xanthomonadaceae bacterium]